MNVTASNEPLGGGARNAPGFSLSVAPMMAWTDRHCRYFLRQFSPSVLLYTEMIVADAIVRGDHARLLAFSAGEQPVALQLGGADPARLAAAAAIGEAAGYREINLNCGCPSERVQQATFGACLMAEPALVADCVAAMRAAVKIPVTVKTRIGIDDQDSYEFLCEFVSTVAAAGCETFIVHARKAILRGLSPKENREIPPLDYPRAWRLKRDYPALTIVLNGGVRSLADCEPHWTQVDGLMIGREAYHRPMFLAELEREVARRQGREVGAPPTVEEIVDRMRPYLAAQRAAGQPLHSMTRHMLGLFAGRPGARSWRRVLSSASTRAEAGIEIVDQALRAAELGQAAA